MVDRRRTRRLPAFKLTAVGLCVACRLALFLSPDILEEFSLIFVGEQVGTRDAKTTAAETKKTRASSVGLVDCNATADVPPVNIGLMTSSIPGVAPHYAISFSW